MKLIEISVLILLLPLFLKNFSLGCVQFVKIQSQLLNAEKNFYRDLSVSSAFKKICENSSESGEIAANQILKNDDEVKVNYEGFADGKILLKCEWKNVGKVNQIYAVSSSK